MLNRFYKITHSIGLFALAALASTAIIDLGWPVPVALIVAICMFVTAGSAVGYIWESERKAGE